MVSRINMIRSHGLARGAVTAAASVLLLGACVPDQQATGNRPVIQAKDDDVEALMRVAAMTRESGDIDTAIALYRRVHERDPADPRPLIEIARMFEARGATADAALVWQEAGRVAPGNAEVLGGYGITLARLGQAQLAQTYLQQAVQKGPTAQIWNALGVVRDRLGDAAGAQTAYRAGLALAPDDTRLANNLALSLALSGHAGEAAALLERVVQRPDAQVRHRQNLALVYALAGRDEDAERMGALDADPADAQRNVMRHASIAALPDHASRVAAVSAVQSASPVRRNEATAAVAAAALIRDRNDSATPEPLAEKQADARVTPLVTLTPVDNHEPQPQAPVVPPAVAPTIAATAPAPIPTLTAEPEPAVTPEPAREERETVVAKAPAQTPRSDLPPADLRDSTTAKADMPVATAAVADRTAVAPERTADQPTEVDVAGVEDVEPKTYRPPLVPAATTEAPAAAEPVDDNGSVAIAAAVGTDSAVGLSDAEARSVDPAAAITVAETPATPSVARLVMQAVDEADPTTDENVSSPAESDGPAVAATEETVTDFGEPALPLSLAGVSVPSVEDQLIVAASAYHAEAYDLAAEVWQRLADAGDARAQFHLGALHYEGRGVDKDLGEAYVLLRRSEEHGFADARIVLALVEAKLSDTERREAEKQVAAAPR